MQELIASWLYIYCATAITCTKPAIMVLVRPPDAAANDITRAIRPTVACVNFPEMYIRTYSYVVHSYVHQKLAYIAIVYS